MLRAEAVLPSGAWDGRTASDTVLIDSSREVDPKTYEVRADGVLLTCGPAEVLPMAQRCFLF